MCLYVVRVTQRSLNCFYLSRLLVSAKKYQLMVGRLFGISTLGKIRKVVLYPKFWTQWRGLFSRRVYLNLFFVVALRDAIGVVVVVVDLLL